MTYEEICTHLAPCGLNCNKCQAYIDGDIRKHAMELKRLLNSFDSYADRFSHFLPVFKKYPAFKELLTFLSNANCKGCRQGDCKYPNCSVLACCAQNKVDFCFQCDAFPCDRTNFDTHLHKKWIAINQRMKEIGLEAYYQETKDMPRYM